ncbi:MAG: DUF3574 domain-containing protein [Thermomicrobiales bacterium]|nr:DUF3574 domain-containing protein [Thermomicrobiales bacterium]
MSSQVPQETRQPRSSLIRRAQLGALALVLLAGGAGVGAFASVQAQGEATPVADATSAAVDACPDELYGAGSEPWVRGELYFGTSMDQGVGVIPDDFEAFLDAEVTPRFPDGLTLLTGLGQWKGPDDVEPSKMGSEVLIILYPQESAAESSAKLEEIREAYKAQFNAQSVLRSDTAPVCTSF